MVVQVTIHITRMCMVNKSKRQQPIPGRNVVAQRHAQVFNERWENPHNSGHTAADTKTTLYTGKRKNK